MAALNHTLGETVNNKVHPQTLAGIHSCPDPLHWGIATPFQEDFVPLGSVTRVESNHEAVIEAARISFERYGSAPQGHQPKILLRLCVDPKCHQLPPWPEPVFRSLNNIFHIACGDSSFGVADLNRGLGIGFFSPEMVKDASFFRSTFLECLFYVLVVRLSHTPIHASCVCLDGRGVLLCGASRTGKSTLAYACAKLRMQIVTDDVVHLCPDPENHGLQLWGNPWNLRLLPDAVRFFPELAGEELKPRSDHELYLEINVPSYFPDSASVSCQPEFLLFLERRHTSRPSLSPISQERAFQRLQRDVFLDEEPVVERHFFVLKQLAQRPSFVLTHSGDPLVVAGMVKSLLQKQGPSFS